MSSESSPESNVAKVLLSLPPGFLHAGTLSASSPGRDGADIKVDCTVALPPRTLPDTSYQQTGVLTVSGGGAQSGLTAAQVPAGFHVECHGSDTRGRRWAVLLPYSGNGVIQAKLDSNYQVLSLTFTLGLYADTGHPGIHGGATTVVEVYYKPLPAATPHIRQ